jgi:glycosyltransferase involved in cell wall biosynthesis
VSDLIESINSVSQWSLVLAKGYYYLTAHAAGVDREFVLPVEEGTLSQLLDPALFDILHLHHSRWFYFPELATAMLAHGRFVVSHHDFNLVCPRFHLLTPADEVCTGFECQSACGYSEERISSLREGSKSLLTAAERVIVFSKSTKHLLESILKEKLPVAILPHGVPINEYAQVKDRKPGDIFRIALVGTISKHKGSPLYKQLVHLQAIASHPIEWHLFGAVDFVAPDHLVDHGPYKRQELSRLMNEAGIDAGLFLSLCPETYSLVVDEVAQAGIPLVVGPYGAPAERIGEYGAGWVLESLNVSAIQETLLSVISDESSYMAARERVRDLPVISVQEEAGAYEAIYSEIQSGDTDSIESVLFTLNERAIVGPPPDPLLWKYLGNAANLIIHIFDWLGIRGAIQRQATALLPAGVLNRIKRAR